MATHAFSFLCSSRARLFLPLLREDVIFSPPQARLFPTAAKLSSRSFLQVLYYYFLFSEDKATSRTSRLFPPSSLSPSARKELGPRPPFARDPLPTSLFKFLFSFSSYEQHTKFRRPAPPAFFFWKISGAPPLRRNSPPAPFEVKMD